MAIITCPNCQSKFPSKHFKNRWVEWYEGECETCGLYFKLKDTQFDFVQPDNPLFNEIYKNKPYEKLKKEKKERDWQKENLKDNREINLKLKVKKGQLRNWELKDIKKITEERNLNG